MKAALTIAVVVLSMVAAPLAAQADDTDYFGKDRPKDELTYRVDRSRTKKQRVVIASLLGGSLVFAGLGLYFHLDSRDKADELSAAGSHTGQVWTQEREDTRNSGRTSGRLAIGGYVLGGALMIAAGVALVMTQPGSELVKVDDSATKPAVPVSIAPVRGGAIVGKGWVF